MLTSIAFAFVAGVLSLLSPCTLPLLPLVLASALGEHRYGAVALAAGLTVSFTLFGLAVALLGHGIGLTEDRVRLFGAIVMAGFGIVLLVPALQERLTLLLEPLGSWSAARFGGGGGRGLGGQALLGAALGAIWSPCVGPTLGAAALMASRGDNVAQVAATMLSFGLGAGVPLAALGLLPRERFDRMRGRLATTGRLGRLALGGLLVATAIAIATGFDKRLEAMLIAVTPAWLLDLTTRF